MSIEWATAIIVALGGPLIIPKAIEGYRVWRTGRAREEKQENRTALERLDVEAFYAYALQEYAARLRLMLVQMGYPEDKLPDWPEKRTKARK